MQRLREFINNEIDEKGWTVTELARRAELAQPTVGDVLNGKTNPGLRFYIGMARALQVSVDHLLRLAGDLPANVVSPEDELTLAELLDVAKRLSPDERADLLEYALWRLRREAKQAEQRGEQPDNRPGFASEGATA